MNNRKTTKNGKSAGKNSQQKPRKARVQNKQNNRSTSKITMAPVSFGNTVTNRRPKIETTRGTDITVRHREYVTTVPRSNAAFQVVVDANGLAINPSNAILFPWLSAIAGRYESFLFEELCIEFRTESSSNTSGYLLFAVDFNADDTAPVTKQQALQYQSVLSGPYWQNMDVKLRKEDLQKRKSYLCNNNPSTGPIEKNLYNTGTLFVAVGGGPDTNIAGDLYVSYKVRLMTPELNPLPGQFILPSGGSNVGTKQTFVSCGPISDTSAIGRPITNELSQQGSVFTALKDISLLLEADFAGTGLTMPDALSAMFFQGSGPPLVNGINYMDIAHVGSGNEAMASSIFKMAKGNFFDVSELTMNSGWTTLQSAGIRGTPWFLT